MKAMIMAAGVGSRLMPLTMNLPKPMIPMANRPLMANIVDLLQQQQITSVIANLHYYPGMISGYFGNGDHYGINMNYSHEDELLGTAGGVKKCEWFLNDTFAVISGDALTDINITALLEKHRQKGALATIALKEVDEVENFGIVVTDEKQRIINFQEKPRRNEAWSKMANTGIYIFEPEIFKYIPPRQFYDFGRQVFPHLVKIGAPFYGISIEQYWCDVGNLKTYREAHRDIVRGRVKLPVSGVISRTGDNYLLAGENVQIGENTSLSGVVVIGCNCKIGNHAVIKDSIIWDSCHIGDNVSIDSAVIGSACSIKNNVVIQPGAVVNSGCNLREGVVISANCKVFNSRGDQLELEQG